MRRLLMILFACLLSISMQGQRITHTYNNVSLSDALSQLAEQQTDYAIMFLYNELEDFRITTTVSRKSLPDAIQQMIGFYPIRTIVDTSNPKEKKIFVECTHKTDRHLTGTIIDEQSVPVAYANVAILNPADSTLLSGGVSNESGYFAIPYEQPTVLARISYVGYKTVYRLCSQPEVGTIQMQPDTYTLKNVVVKGKQNALSVKDGAFLLNVSKTFLKDQPDIFSVLAFLPFVEASEGRVSVFGAGSTLYLVNGREVRSMAEIEALRPDLVKNSCGSVLGFCK